MSQDERQEKFTGNQTLNISHLFLLVKRSGCLKSAGYIDAHTDIMDSIRMMLAGISTLELCSPSMGEEGIFMSEDV